MRIRAFTLVINSSIAMTDEFDLAHECFERWHQVGWTSAGAASMFLSSEGRGSASPFISYWLRQSSGYPHQRVKLQTAERGKSWKFPVLSAHDKLRARLVIVTTSIFFCQYWLNDWELRPMMTFIIPRVRRLRKFFLDTHTPQLKNVSNDPIYSCMLYFNTEN